MSDALSLAGNLHNSGGTGISLPKAVFPHEGAALLGLIVDLQEPPYTAYEAEEPKKYVDKFTGKEEVERQLVVTILVLGGDAHIEDVAGKAARQAHIDTLRQQDPTGNLAARFDKENPVPTRPIQPGDLVRQYYGKRHVYFAASKALRTFGANNLRVGTVIIEQRGTDEWVTRDGKPLQNAKRPRSFVFREAQGAEASWVPAAIEAKNKLQPAPSLAGNVQAAPVAAEPFPAAPVAQAPAQAPAQAYAPAVAAPAPVAAPVAQAPAPAYAPAAPAAAPVAPVVVAAPAAAPVTTLTGLFTQG